MIRIEIIIIGLCLALNLGCTSLHHEMPITTQSEEARELFLEARELVENVQYGKADSILRDAIRIDPEFALAYLYLSKQSGLKNAIDLVDKVTIGERIMINATKEHYLRNFSESMIFLDSLVALFPKDKHCWYYASLYYRRSNPEKAIEMSQKAIQIDRYYAAAHNLLAYNYIDIDKYELAREVFQNYINLYKGENYNALDSFAEMLTLSGEYQEAINVFKKILYSKPTWTSKYYKIAWNYIHLGKFDLAQEYAEKLFNYNLDENIWVKQQRHGLGMMATIRFVQGDVCGAQALMDRQIHLAQKHNASLDMAKGWLYKGWYAVKGDKIAEGIKIFKQGLDLILKSTIELENPTLLTMRFYGGLSIAYGEMGKIDSSGFYLERAQFMFSKLEPNTYASNIMQTYQSALAILNGDYDFAIDALSPIREYGSPWRYYLAKAYEMKGNNKLAIKYYYQALHQWTPFNTGLYYNDSKKTLEALRNN